MIFYKVTDQELIKEFDMVQTKLRFRSKILTEISKEIGADPGFYNSPDGMFLGFKFTKNPPNQLDWKKVSNVQACYFPRNNTETGRKYLKIVNPHTVNLWNGLVKVANYNKFFYEPGTGTIHKYPNIERFKDCLIYTIPFFVYDNKDYKVPEIFEEILYSEYSRLKQEFEHHFKKTVKFI